MWARSRIWPGQSVSGLEHLVIVKRPVPLSVKTRSIEKLPAAVIAVTAVARVDANATFIDQILIDVVFVQLTLPTFSLADVTED